VTQTRVLLRAHQKTRVTAASVCKKFLEKKNSNLVNDVQPFSHSVTVTVTTRVYSYSSVVQLL
jgi:hypothetical protein